MNNKLFLEINGMKCEYKTIHVIDDDVKKIFQNLVDPYNKMHWTDEDIVWFLKKNGKLILHKFIGALDVKNDCLYVFEHLEKRKIEKIERIIICLYTSSMFPIIEYDNILKKIIKTLCINEEVIIMTGWIVDENILPEVFEVKLIAIYSNEI